MANVSVKEITAADAAQAMRAAGLRAPLPCDTPEGIAAHGRCFELRTDTGVGVFVLRVKGSVLWVDGAGSRDGHGLTAAGLPLFERIARQTGCDRIAFETGRRGLVRLSQTVGYRVAGYIMEKAVQ